MWVWTIYEGYGLTETTAAVTVKPSRSDQDRDGRPADRAARPRAIAEDGELLFKAPNVFRGYWNNADATSEALD